MPTLLGTRHSLPGLRALGSEQLLCNEEKELGGSEQREVLGEGQKPSLFMAAFPGLINSNRMSWV